ncbi:MAG: hypothetical protein KC561_04900 [Myxococcales bacterium]|nr:hypothetical protein [Myxococcales bacterium]
MIRINLLPIKQERKREYGQQQLILFFFLVVLEVVILYMAYGEKKSVVEELDGRIAELEQGVARIGDLEGELRSKRQRITRLIARFEEEDTLARNRIGPAGPLQELAFLMNPPEDAQTRIAMRERGFDLNMDIRNVWIDRLEITPSRYRLSVHASNDNEMEEFINRLQLPDPEGFQFFTSARLGAYDRHASDPIADTDVMVISFGVSGAVAFHPMP